MSAIRIDRRARLRRRRQARRRGLIALVAIVALVIVGGIALARALTGGRGEAPAAARDGSGQTAAHAASGAAGATPAELPAVRVVSGGDVMTDRVVKDFIGTYGADAVLRGIAPQLEKGDAAWVNLECPLSTLGSPTPGKDYTFEGPPSMAKALADAGIDLVTMGNNHTVDYGPVSYTHLTLPTKRIV